MPDGVRPTGVWLRIRIDPGSTPIQGRLRIDGASEVAFTGWIELVRLLEAVRHGSDPAHHDTHPTR